MSDYYKDAARAIRLVVDGKTSVKGAVFAAKPANIRRTYALVVEAAKHLAALQTLVAAVPQLRQHTSDESILLVVLHDHCWGAGIQGGGAVKRAVIAHDAAIRSAAAAAGIVFSKKQQLSTGAASVTQPRYVRVNTLVASVPAVILGLTSASAGAPSGRALAVSEVHIDPHIPYVLRLPGDAHQRLSLHGHALVAASAAEPYSGGGSLPVAAPPRGDRAWRKPGGVSRVILQDKASCLPVHALLWDCLPPELRGNSGRGGGSRGGASSVSPSTALESTSADVGAGTGVAFSSRKRKRQAGLATQAGHNVVEAGGSAAASAAGAPRVTLSHPRDELPADVRPSLLVPAGCSLVWAPPSGAAVPGTAPDAAPSGGEPSRTTRVGVRVSVGTAAGGRVAAAGERAEEEEVLVTLAFPEQPLFRCDADGCLLQLLPLGPPPFDGLDVCAAPGNKTTQLAALLHEVGAHTAGAAAAARLRLAQRTLEDAAATTADTSVAAGAAAAAQRERERRERKQARRAARRADQQLAFYGGGVGDAAAAAPASGADVVSFGPAPRLTLEAAPPLPAATAAHVFAFDKSRERAAVLSARVAEAGAAGVISVTCADVTETDLGADPRLCRVRVAVVDPSCSGSGMSAHAEQGAVAAPTAAVPDAEAAVVAAPAGTSAFNWPPLVPPPSEAARVSSLAGFQRRILLHALRSLPRLVRASYSTCSVWWEEDEGVVAGVMHEWDAEGHTLGELDTVAPGAATGPEAASPSAPPRIPLRLVLLPSIPSWPRRGVSSSDAPIIGKGLPPALAAACLRAFPSLDETGGFFVAVLHKAAVVWTPPATK